MERQAREGLVDWPAVERVAIARLAAAPGALSAAELRATEPAYAAAMARIVPVLSRALGQRAARRRRAFRRRRPGRLGAAPTPRPSPRSSASSRHDLLDQVVPVGGGLAKATMALANRWITTRQLGFLLGFLGQRVLGQYDIALLSAEAHARPAALRRGEHPRARRGPWACRSTVPHVDRPARDDPRLRVRGPPLAAAVPRRRASSAS